MKKTLTLDYSKWRCGSNSDNQLGEGTTLLRNEEGFECCLGQFAAQLKEGLTDEQLDHGTPDMIGLVIPPLTKKMYDLPTDTRLSLDAMKINDAEQTTPAEKITQLKKLFAKKGIKIRVINREQKPKRSVARKAQPKNKKLAK